MFFRRTPRVTERHHREVVAELRAQIAERDARLAKLADERDWMMRRYLETATGQELPEPTKRPAIARDPLEEEADINKPDENISELDEAVRLAGTRNARGLGEALNRVFQSRKETKNALFVRAGQGVAATPGTLEASLFEGVNSARGE